MPYHSSQRPTVVGVTQVYGIWEIRPALSLDMDVAGTTWRVGPSPAACWLHLPSAPALAETQLQPPSDGERERIAISLMEAHHERLWGARMLSVDHTSSATPAARIERALIEWTFDGEDDESSRQAAVTELFSALDTWWVQVCDWLEVLTREWLNAPGHLVTPSHDVWTVTDGRFELFTNPNQQINVMIRRLVAAAHWATAIAQANTRAEPPPSHRILRDARTALAQGQRRRAVLDCGTAAELALSRRVHAELAASEELRINALLKSVNGLLGLVDLFRALVPHSTLSRGKVMDLLARHRNDAAHGGREPTEEEAQQALNLATTIVDEADPLRHQ